MKKAQPARSSKRVTKGSPFSPLAKQLGMFALFMAVVGSGLSYSAKVRGDVLGTNRYALVQSDPYTGVTPKPVVKVVVTPTVSKPTAAPVPKTNVTTKPAANPTPTSYVCNTTNCPVGYARCINNACVSTSTTTPTSTPKPVVSTVPPIPTKTPTPTTYVCTTTNCQVGYGKCVNNVCVSSVTTPTPCPTGTIRSVVGCVKASTPTVTVKTTVKSPQFNSDGMNEIEKKCRDIAIKNYGSSYSGATSIVQNGNGGAGSCSVNDNNVNLGVVTSKMYPNGSGGNYNTTGRCCMNMSAFRDAAQTDCGVKTVTAVMFQVVDGPSIQSDEDVPLNCFETAKKSCIDNYNWESVTDRIVSNHPGYSKLGHVAYPSGDAKKCPTISKGYLGGPKVKSGFCCPN